MNACYWQKTWWPAGSGVAPERPGSWRIDGSWPARAIGLRFSARKARVRGTPATGGVARPHGDVAATVGDRAASAIRKNPFPTRHPLAGCAARKRLLPPRRMGARSFLSSLMSLCGVCAFRPGARRSVPSSSTSLVRNTYESRRYRLRKAEIDNVHN